MTEINTNIDCIPTQPSCCLRKYLKKERNDIKVVELLVPCYYAQGGAAAYIQLTSVTCTYL